MAGHTDKIHALGLEVQRAVSQLLEITLQAGPLASWRSIVALTQRHLWAMNIQDGTTRGDRLIGELILRMATGHPDPSYRNGALSWCGLFAQACYRSAGFSPALTLASVGKVIQVYARYKPGALKGSAAWAVDRATGEVLKIQELHEARGQLRQIGRPDEMDLEVGDLLIHERDPGSWHGHVMTVGEAIPDLGRILTVEGNHSKAVGPDGKVRDGVGTRYLLSTDPYLTWGVKPSPLDFATWISYHATKAQAQAEAKRLTDEDRELALAQEGGHAAVKAAGLDT